MNKPKKPSSHVSLGYNLAMGIGLLAFIGYWIDEKKQSQPFCTLVGVGLGFAYGIYEIWKYTRNHED